MQKQKRCKDKTNEQKRKVMIKRIGKNNLKIPKG